jgi:hypothetical protein
MGFEIKVGKLASFLIRRGYREKHYVDLSTAGQSPVRAAPALVPGFEGCF